MGDADHAAVGSHLRLLFEAGTVTGVSDGHLLEMFVTRRDELAFTALLERHGPMVHRVCHAVLGDHHDAQDAFQATFLVLARSAGSIRRRDSLASWLYGAALRVAARARSASARRREHERNWAALRAAETEGGPESRDDIEALLHEEIGRLPERFRAPVVLCYLEGRTYEEAAQVLLCPVGTIKSRLSTARERLRRRLEHRDPATSSGSIGLAFQEGPPVTTVPAPLPASTLQAVVRHATGGVAPASISRLAQGVLKTMLWHRVSYRLGVAVAILIGTASLAAGAIGLMRRNRGLPANGPQDAAAPATGVAQPVPLVMKPAPEDGLPTGATMRFGSPRFRHPSTIQSLAVSPDGKIAVANSGSGFHGALRAYDLATGRALPAIDRSGVDGGLALSPDGKTLAIATAWSPAVYLYDMTTGAETARISYPDVNPGSTNSLLLFAPDGAHLVTQAAGGKELHLIGLAKREVVRTFPCAGTVFTAALSPDGKRLVAGGFDYENTRRGWFASRWEVDTGRVRAPLPLSNGGIRSVAYSPDGATIAIGDGEIKATSVTLIEAATGKKRLKVPLPVNWIVQSLAFSPDSKTLAASGGPSTRLFDTATGEERLKIDRKAIGLRFSPDGATLVGAVGGTIYRWDAITGRSLIPEGGDSSVDQIAVTPDGDRLITRGNEGDGHIWDARTGEHRRRLEMGWQRGFALSPDGRFLAWPAVDESIEFPDPVFRGATAVGRRLRLFDLAAGAPVERFGGFAGEAHDLYFIDGGKTVVTVEHHRRDAEARLWDVATGRVARSFPAEGPDPVWRSRLSPDGKVLAVTYVEQPVSAIVGRRTVKLWDLATGKEREGQPGHWDDDEVMAFSRDGKTVAIATYERSIQFRDAATWQLRGEFRGLRDRVTALAFGPDGRLFSGCLDGTVLAWDPRAAKPPAGRE